MDINSKISIGLPKRVAKAIIDVLHNKPSAEVDLKKAEADLKRAEANLKNEEANLKKAQSKYVTSKAQKGAIDNYYLLEKFLDRLGYSEQEKRKFLLNQGEECQEAIKNIHEMHNTGRILAVQMEEE